MASVRGARRIGVRTSSQGPVVEEIVPNSGWTEDSAAHYLLVDLPGMPSNTTLSLLEIVILKVLYIYVYIPFGLSAIYVRIYFKCENTYI